ncbi:hypothetical protein L2E82_20758 [Cichorium intybus]|uniref:Uncharacterized protein n=1 Tax=Cichorium intybus TaxID=13427 RepID=A0ACB9DUJ3_CICIN|nr:hypothetical protein L2E82_20758 [Cichorium intybus]
MASRKTGSDGVTEWERKRVTVQFKEKYNRKKSLEHAAIGSDELSKIDKERASVIVGSGMGGTKLFYDGVKALKEKGYQKISPFLTPYQITSMAPALLAIDLGFTGPTYSISATCATFINCFCAAANHIREGKVDLMIAGGTESSIVPMGLAGMGAMRALSQRND